MKTSKRHGSEEGHHAEHHHDEHHDAEKHHEEKRHEENVGSKKEIPDKVNKSTPGKYYPLISGIVIVVLLTLVIFLLVRNPGSGLTNTGGSGTVGNFKGDKVKVEFYVMSQCPYGTQVEDAIGPVLQKMGDGVDFHLNYIVREASPGVFQSLHGDKEVVGDLAQVCVKSYYPDKLVDFVLCQNKDAANVDTNWQSCAQQLSMDSVKIQTCLQSDTGKSLLRTSMQATQARGATGSPTIYINDVSYSGARDSLSFQRAICKYSTHPECAGIPKCAADSDCTEQAGKEGTCNNPGKADASCTYTDPVAVNLLILNDKTCTTCDTTRIVQVSQQLFLGVKPRLVDVSSDEGKTLVKQYNITVVPAYIFDKNVEQTKSWTSTPDLNTAFDTLGDGKQKLKDEVTGATYFISEEARKAYYSAIGVVKGDNKPQIDFFVMAFCPYGNQAEEAIAPVYNLLKDKAIFKPHYVIYPNYQGGGADYCAENGKYCSMHGIQELHQDMRELCVNKYMGIGSWFDFALAINKACTPQNADTCWEAVAKNLSLDTSKIKTCQDSEGISLVAAEQALGDKLKVQGSPTVFVDGDPYGAGRTPEEFKTALCQAFTTAPGECSTTLAGPAATAPGAAAAPATGGCGV